MGRPKGSKNGVHTLVAKTCEVCGKPFSLKPSHADKEFCCSPKCHGKRLSRVRQHEIEQQFGRPVRDLLDHLYNDEKLTSRQIMAKLGINSHAFIRWCNEFGIRRRDRPTAVAMQWKDNPERRSLASRIMSALGLGRAGDANVSKRPEVRQKISESKQGELNAMYGKFGEQNPHWKGGKITYRGKGWRGIMVQARRRDGNKCCRCGSSDNLQVHHIKPYRIDQDNSLENLVTLCASCHMAVEYQSAAWD